MAIIGGGFIEIIRESRRAGQWRRKQLASGGGGTMPARSYPHIYVFATEKAKICCKVLQKRSPYHWPEAAHVPIEVKLNPLYCVQLQILSNFIQIGQKLGE